MKLSDPSLAYDASRLLQAIEDEVKTAGFQHTQMDVIDPKVRFPRGYIRGAISFRQRYRCHRHQIADNVAYTLQFHDVLRWILNRTDLSLTAQMMIVKYGIVSIHSVIEAVIWDRLSELRKSPGKKFEKNLAKLREAGLIDGVLERRLRSVHVKREKIHLDLYCIKGDEEYRIDDWNAAVRALEDLRVALS